MFEIYCEDIEANRNDLVDRLLNGSSLETRDGRFAWVNGAMSPEIAALKPLLNATSGKPQLEIAHGAICRAVLEFREAMRDELQKVNFLVSAFEEDFAALEC